VVAARVDALGLTPPPVVAVELTKDTLAEVRALPDGDALASGLTVFAENCTACHGGNGEGTALAPALNTADLRARLTDDDIERIVTQGVPGTLMAAWGGALQPQEVTDLIAFLRGWETLDAAGVEMAAAPAPVLDMSPEAIAAGQQLYNVLCTQCHGVSGYGTRLAPALNNELFLSQTPDAVIQQIIAGGVTGTAMPAWGGRLTEADIAALTAYLRSWEPTAPPIVQP
jgi:cbb3-type cytochrome c oxidase subunit III